MNFLRKLFCFHQTLKVIRWHPSRVTPGMKGKLLYVDRLNVHNFIQCVQCKKIFHTEQREKLLDTKEA